MSLRWPTKFCLLFIASLLIIPSCFADYALNMPVGVSPVSEKIHSLHMIILWICVAIGIVVYGLMVCAIIKHRKSTGHQAATFHESTTVEIIWTVIPFIILIAMAIPATITLKFMDDTKEADLTVKITGYRWYWKYDYLDQDIGFYSYLSTPEDQIKNIAPKSENYLLEVDRPLVLPINKKIRFVLTSEDVQHAWWVPQLGVKKDAIPWFINEFWTSIRKPGTYRGQCAELCGANHGYMPIVVEAMSEEDYLAWIAEQKGQAKAKVHDMTKMAMTED